MRFHLRPSFTPSSSAYRRMSMKSTTTTRNANWLMWVRWPIPIRLPNLTLKTTFCVRKKKKTLCASVNEWICALQLHVLHSIANVPSHLVCPRGLPPFSVGDSVVTSEPLLWESSEKQKKKKFSKKNLISVDVSHVTDC